MCCRVIAEPGGWPTFSVTARKYTPQTEWGAPPFALCKGWDKNCSMLCCESGAGGGGCVFVSHPWQKPAKGGHPPELLHNPFLKWEVSRTRVTPNIHIGASAAIP